MVKGDKVQYFDQQGNEFTATVIQVWDTGNVNLVYGDSNCQENDVHPYEEGVNGHFFKSTEEEPQQQEVNHEVETVDTPIEG